VSKVIDGLFPQFLELNFSLAAFVVPPATAFSAHQERAERRAFRLVNPAKKGETLHTCCSCRGC
jgi:hypothetical protein